MTDKEQLTKLIGAVQDEGVDYSDCFVIGDKPNYIENHTLANYLVDNDVIIQKHGCWVLEAHEEYANYRWNVTAKCSECNKKLNEIYAGFMSGFPKDLAEMIILDSAKSVKMPNYCDNCGVKMDN